MIKDTDIERMEILAWVGPDEFDGSRGIKSAQTRVGWVPLAFKGEHQDRAERLRGQLQDQADLYGTRIRLVRFKLAEVIDTIEPCPDPEQSADPGASTCPVEGCGARYDEDDYAKQRIHLSRDHMDLILSRQEELARTDGWVLD